MEKDVRDHTEVFECCVLAKPIEVHTPLGHLCATKPLELVAIDFTMMEKAKDSRENVFFSHAPMHLPSGH